MGVNGFYGDIFSDGFGGFQTMRKRHPEHDPSGQNLSPQQLLEGVHTHKVRFLFFYCKSCFYLP